MVTYILKSNKTLLVQVEVKSTDYPFERALCGLNKIFSVDVYCAFLGERMVVRFTSCASISLFI
jgi:hypothetical protein